MTSDAKPSNEALSQLIAARILALGDAAYYPQIVKGVLPIIGPRAPIELRRWGADFLAETFASPTLASDQKQQLSIGVLQTLKEFLEVPEEDSSVVKSVVQAAGSVFPLIFKHIISNPNDGSTWQKMAAIKSNILRRMDSAPAGVKICCVKFIQRVVQMQTPGLIADPRRPEKNEISLSLVPRDHPLLTPATLEAEASGLLDRLLSVFQDNVSDALLVTATLNSAGVLVRTRPTVANKIITVILNFNPLKQMNSPMTYKLRVTIKSIERTTRAFLLHIQKRIPNHPLGARIQAFLEQLQRSWVDIFEENTRKRPAESTSISDPTKRQRLDDDATITPPFSSVPSLPIRATTYAQLFTLTQDPVALAFDANAIQIDILNKILVPVLNSIDPTNFDNSINAIRSRYLTLQQVPPVSPFQGLAAAYDDDDNYDPDYQLQQNAEQLRSGLDTKQFDSILGNRPADVALTPFKIPQPPPLTPEEAQAYGQGTVNRMFGIINEIGESPQVKAGRAGFNRLAASQYERDSWVTILVRLATRSTAGLDDYKAKKESHSEQVVVSRDRSIGDMIRDSLFIYILSDFRRRIDIAISWLNEEWYNDKVLLKSGGPYEQKYERLALKVLDSIVPYLDAKDKVLIRFLSEIPEFNRELLERVKKLARDPERVSLAVNSILYLILFRPPVREMCIDALEDLYRNYDDAKVAAAKPLAKWRPQVVGSSNTSLKSINSKSPVPPGATATAAG